MFDGRLPDANEREGCIPASSVAVGAREGWTAGREKMSLRTGKSRLRDVNQQKEDTSDEVEMAATTTMPGHISEQWMATKEAPDRADFDQVAREYRPQIFRFLLSSTRDAELAETLTQDCLMKAYRNWNSFRGDSRVLTWLLRIAINLQKDQWRNRRLQFWRQTTTNAVDVSEAGNWLPSEASTPEQQVAARQQVKLVWQAVEKLSGRQRSIFLLRHVEEMEIAEIAAAMGLSEGTVKAHLSRATGRVREELGGRQ